MKLLSRSRTFFERRLGVRLASPADVLRRSAALLLIALALIPFTAPFSTYDVSQHRSDPIRRHAREVSTDPSAVRVVSIATTDRRPRLDAQSRDAHAAPKPIAAVSIAKAAPQTLRLGCGSAAAAILRI